MRIRVAGRAHVVDGSAPFTIGRDPSCDAMVIDERVSRRHVEVRPEAGGWLLVDLGSRNGIFHDGARVEQLRIVSNLQVRLANPRNGPAVELEFGTPDVEAFAQSSATLAERVIEEVPSGNPPPPTPTAALSGALDEIGTFSGSHHIGGPTVRIGRAPDNDVVVDDLLVSRRHAELRLDPQRGYMLVDLDSQNGTFIDGTRIRESPVGPRDVVTIGRHTFRLIDGRLEEYIDSGIVSFAAAGLVVRAASRAILLDQVSFSLPERGFMAVVGPTGAGKSTLINALTGFRPADQGTVLYAGWDLYRHYDLLQHRIGYVPQDDVLHPQLTVRRALDYAAELRFPADVSAADRRERVDEVMRQLGIADRAHLPIHQLSGGQRKRTSIALELLTRPSLLILDEPTSGLDPGFERVVMRLLRELADDGRTVIVVTHNLQSLDLCDRVLFLAPGGRVAYFGPPDDATEFFGSDNHADIFNALSSDQGMDWTERFRTHPDYRAFIESPLADVGGRQQATERQARPQRRTRGWGAQFSVLLRRYISIICSDRRNLLFLCLQPLILGLLLLAMMPTGQLDLEAPTTQASRAAMVLLSLVLTITWVAASNSIREIVKELPIYRRERSIGLSVSAYVASKIVVLAFITALQMLLLVAIAVRRQGGPDSATNLSSPMGELMLGIGLAGLAAMALGLLVSASVNSSDKALTIFPLLLVPQLVFSGPIFPVEEKPVVREVSWLASANWGFAAVASSVDLNLLEEQRGAAATRDAETRARWEHRPGRWRGAIVALSFLAIGCMAAAWYVLKRRDRLLF